MGVSKGSDSNEEHIIRKIAPVCSVVQQILVQMSSDPQCGLGSLLPMSCRGRAEAFARRLHTRLRHLGAEPRTQEVPWLVQPLIAEPPAAQRLSSDSDVFFDFDVDIDSPSSPAEEVTEGELAAIAANKNQKDPESGCVLSSPVDNDSPHSNSDSDAYYDLEVDSDSAVKIANNIKRINDECQVAKNLAKLKFTSPAAEIIDNFVQNRFSPERKSPIKTQPLAKENGYSEYPEVKRSDSLNSLYSPIKFDDCKRRNSLERPKSDTDPSLQQKAAAPAMPGDVVACNGNSSPVVDRDEVDFSQHIQVNGHDTSLHDSKINICIETDTPENHSNGNDCVIKAINVEVICDKKDDEEYGEEAEEVKEEAVAEDAREVQHRLEKLTLVDINGEDVTAQNEEDCQDNNSGDNDVDGDDKPERVRRCSSLRSGKTPPGTPGRKKIVRFADVLGLDLADVKTFMDDIPYIPKSAFRDLQDADLSASSTESFPPIDVAQRSEKTLLCLFQQPGNLPNFLDILNTRSVCLENAVVQEGASLSICGTVRVRNLDFHKSVQIRYTLDGWKTFADLQASYVPNSCDGFCDRFTFLLYAHTLTIGQKLEFAVRFMCKGCQYWDNNLGVNYRFQCIPNDGGDPFFPSSACIARSDSWQGSFY